MESHIKIKSNRAEMSKAFKNCELYSIRHCKELRRGLFEAVVQHKELPNCLEGTYTIKQLNTVLE